MEPEPKYDRKQIGSYIEAREAMTGVRKDRPQSTRKIQSQQAKLELKFTKLPPSKEKLLCIYLEKFQTIVHSFITEFLESQIFRFTKENIPNNYNLKTKIKLMNYILLKFDCRTRKLLQEEVLSTICHLVCHQRKLLKSQESHRNCALNSCNASDLIWALQNDHTRHFDELLRRLKLEFSTQLENQDPIRIQNAYTNDELLPIYSSTGDRPKSPRVIPDMHYKNVIEQIFHRKGCKCNHSAVYAVRKDTELPPPPYDRTSLLFDKVTRKSRKLVTSYSRNNLPSTTDNNVGSGDSAYYTGIFGIRSPEERKILECKVAAHLRDLGYRYPFKVRPSSAAISSYRRMIVNEITTLQTFEDSLLNYALLSKCVPILWCGTDPDGKPLLYHTEYGSCDCNIRIGQNVNNLPLSNQLFKVNGLGRDGSQARRAAEAQNSRKGRKCVSDTSINSFTSTRQRSGKSRKKRGRKRQSSSVAATNTESEQRSGREDMIFGKPLSRSEQHLVNQTTSVLEAMLAKEFAKSHGETSTEVHTILTELEYRKMTEQRGPPQFSDDEKELNNNSKYKPGRKTLRDLTVRKKSKLSSTQLNQINTRSSRSQSCGTDCEQYSQTSSRNQATANSGSGNDSYQSGVKSQPFKLHPRPSQVSSRVNSFWSEQDLKRLSQTSRMVNRTNSSLQSSQGPKRSSYDKRGSHADPPTQYARKSVQNGPPRQSVHGSQTRRSQLLTHGAQTHWDPPLKSTHGSQTHTNERRKQYSSYATPTWDPKSSHEAVQTQDERRHSSRGSQSTQSQSRSSKQRLTDTGVGDSWADGRRGHLSTGVQYAREKFSKDTDINPMTARSRGSPDEATLSRDDSSLSKHGTRFSTTGSDPIHRFKKDIGVGEGGTGSRTRISHERDKGIGEGVVGTRDRAIEVKESDQEDGRRSNSSERRWRHATFSGNLVRDYHRGSLPKTKSKKAGPLKTLSRLVGKGQLKIVESEKDYEPSFEARLKLSTRKQTGFVRKSAQERLEDRNRQSIRPEGRMSKPGLDAEAQAEKFFSTLKPPKVVPRYGIRRGPESSLEPWKTVERAGEYSKAVRAVNGSKPLAWNMNQPQEGWDDVGRDGRGWRRGMSMDPQFALPPINRNGGRKFDDLRCHGKPDMRLGERTSSRMIPQEPDELIDLSVPQENFFWVPLGRYSWEVRNVKVWKSRVVQTSEKLDSGRDYMRIFPEIKVPLRASTSSCYYLDNQVHPQRFFSCANVCSECLLDSCNCECD